MYYWSLMHRFPSNQEPARRGRIFSEELLHSNLGKVITVYLTYENNPQWNAKIVTGTLREAGRDFILIRDQKQERISCYLI